MEAVCRGVARAAGSRSGSYRTPTRRLPAPSSASCSPRGSARRNALVARAACCVVAIGQSHGTLSEVALDLQFGKPVFGLAGAARVPVYHLGSVDELLNTIAGLVLALAP